MKLIFGGFYASNCVKSLGHHIQGFDMYKEGIRK